MCESKSISRELSLDIEYLILNSFDNKSNRTNKDNYSNLIIVRIII